MYRCAHAWSRVTPHESLGELSLVESVCLCYVGMQAVGGGGLIGPQADENGPNVNDLRTVSGQ